MNTASGFAITENIRAKGMLEIQLGMPNTTTKIGPFARANLITKHANFTYEGSYLGKPVGELSISTLDFFASVKPKPD